MRPKIRNMNPNKDNSEINSSLGDITASIHLEEEFFISSPKIVTVKSTRCINAQNQIFTPIRPKNHISSTVFIKCEYKSPGQKSNSVKLGKSNISKKNISYKNLIYEPFNNLKIELNDIDNADINSGNERKKIPKKNK